MAQRHDVSLGSKWNVLRGVCKDWARVRCKNVWQVVQRAASPGYLISRWRTKSATPQDEHISRGWRSRVYRNWRLRKRRMQLKCCMWGVEDDGWQSLGLAWKEHSLLGTAVQVFIQYVVRWGHMWHEGGLQVKRFAWASLEAKKTHAQKPGRRRASNFLL